MSLTWIRGLFWCSALVDAGLGLLFLVGWEEVFARFEVTPPNHAGYVQFPALLLILFGILFARIAISPVRFRELIWYGVGLKASYVGLVFYYQIRGGIPSMWVPFAYADLLFLAAFIAAWRQLGEHQTGNA